MASAESSSNITSEALNEEAEEDLANNNDPNNNAPNMDAIDGLLSGEHQNDEEAEVNTDDEVDILNLLPDVSREEVRQRLKAHWSDPSRKQVSQYCFRT